VTFLRRPIVMLKEEHGTSQASHPRGGWAGEDRERVEAEAGSKPVQQPDLWPELEAIYPPAADAMRAGLQK